MENEMKMYALYKEDNFWVHLMIEVETFKQALILTATNILHCGQWHKIWPHTLENL